MTRYVAFLSYSHADEAVARWLHRAIETYRLPKALVGAPSPFGPVSRRLPPVFRDRDELHASGDLGEDLRAALAESRFQIVLCSPRAAASKWVNEEIISFKRLHGEARTLALIIGGEPYAGGEQECFPPALRFKLGADGALSDVPAEPIAADIRPGKDGRRLALLKLIAGIGALRLDALVRRDAARRQRRLVLVASVSAAVALVTIALAIYAEGQRRIAERQRRIADTSLDFLIGTFAIANPATENPRTITALTILDRASKRARQDFAGEPAVAARLLQATGKIYYNLGLVKKSAQDLTASIKLNLDDGEQQAASYLKLSDLAFNAGDSKKSRTFVNAADAAYITSARKNRAIEAQIEKQRSMVAFLDGHYAVAAKGLADAVRLIRALPGDNREDLGKVLILEARAMIGAERPHEARALFQQAAELYTNSFGPDHVQTASAVQNLALMDFESHDYESAEEQISRSVKIFDKILEADHPSIAAALILQGRVRTARGDAPGAIAAFNRARGIYTRIYGGRNAAVGDVDFYAAEAEAKRGNVAGALALAATTKAIYDQSYGPNDPDQVELLLLRTRILAGAGRNAAARRDCAAALALQHRLEPRSAQNDAIARTCAAISGADHEA